MIWTGGLEREDAMMTCHKGHGSPDACLIDEVARRESTRVFEECQKYIAGGDSSAMRLSNSRPIVISHGDGAYFFDVDGNRYVDWLCGYGPLIFGHRPQLVIEAVIEQLKTGGSMYGFPNQLAAEVARLIVDAVPSIDQVRFANSGSEASQATMRLARAYTGKEKILKFEGCYHGFLDCQALSTHPPLEVAGPESAPYAVRFKAGIPRVLEETILIGTFNDFEGVERLIREHRHEIAAVVCEPVMSNAGIIPPADGWLRCLRELTEEHDMLLIFDEVITGFRLSLSGAQGLYGVEPDLTFFAKALGGGTPGAAVFGGRSEVMAMEARGDVFHGGTYAGNPLALAGMKATLSFMTEHRDDFYGHLSSIADATVDGLRKIFAGHGVQAQVAQVKGIWSIFFDQEEPVARYRQARASNMEFYRELQMECQARGVFFHDNPLENWFCSYAHSQIEVDKTLEVVDYATEVVKQRLRN